MKLSNNNQKQQAPKRLKYSSAILRYLGTAALALSTALFLTACANSASDQAATSGGMTAKQVIENPSAYVGKTVTVSGNVEEIWNARAFNMDSGLSIGELLVIGREPFPQLPEAGNRAFLVNDVATVTGVVRMLVTADIEREIGWDLDPKIEAEFNSKPVLIAQSISFRAGAAGSAPMTNTGANQQTTNASQTTGNSNAGQTTANSANQNASGTQMIDAGVYASTADKLSLAGKEGQFSNLRVVRVVGPRTFTVASGNMEIYVMLDEESARGVGTQGKIKVGSTLDISGQFERLEAAEINNLADNRFRPLTEQERAFLKNTQIFLQAERIENLK